MNERDVKGLNFVFVGGSHGIGRATAMALAKRGASICIVSRGQEAAEAAINEAVALGASSANFIKADLASVAGIKQAIADIKAWRPEIHGLMHTAMSAFNQRITTEEGFDFAFVLQYLARAAINRGLRDELSASGDGRVVHIAGNVSEKMAGVDLDDLQFSKRKWSFFKSILGTHHLGFLHLQSASQKWADLPISMTACCVESVKTKAMTDPEMPWFMRLMGKFGTSPELAARNAVTVLTQEKTDNIRGAILRSSKKYEPELIQLNESDAAKLWDITTVLTADRGLELD